MSKVNISALDLNLSSYSYSVKEIVDDIFRNKLDEEVRNFSKNELGIDRVYKAFDLENIDLENSQFQNPDVRLNDMYVAVAEKALHASKLDASDIGLLTTINDNQQYLDPSPTVEVSTRLGLSEDVRTQNYQGLACSSFSESLLNAAGYFALGNKKDVLVLIGTYYTSWFLDRLKQIKRVTKKNKSDFNNFIYFLIFSDAAAVAILSNQNKSKKSLAQIDTKMIFSLKDITEGNYNKATVRLSPDKTNRIIFDMRVNSKMLKESIARLSVKNISRMRKNYPKEFEKVKLWGFHTAGSRFVDYIREECGIDKENANLTYELMKETGNTGAASSLQLINESIKRKILQKGDVGCIVDFGWEGADTFLYNVQ